MAQTLAPHSQAPLPLLRTASEPRSAQRAWLLECVRELWGSFRTRFLALWDAHGSKGDAYQAQLFGSGGGNERVRAGWACCAGRACCAVQCG